MMTGNRKLCGECKFFNYDTLLFKNRDGMLFRRCDKTGAAVERCEWACKDFYDPTRKEQKKWKEKTCMRCKKGYLGSSYSKYCPECRHNILSTAAKKRRETQIREANK